MSSIEQKYEELRKIIDGGSESMTHADAVKQLKLMDETWFEMLASLKDMQSSLEWAAVVIGDVPEKSSFMDTIREGKAVIEKAKGIV